MKRSALRGIAFLALAFGAQLAEAAPYFRWEPLTLDALWRKDGISSAGYSPILDSYVKASLFDSVTGQRIYREIILQHGIWDDNDQYYVFSARLQSANGEMPSRTTGTPGAPSHCYTAAASAHANDFNIHERYWPDMKDCMPPEPEKPDDIPKENCPVILDLSLDGFHLSGPDPSVSFDIDADGQPDQIAWTAKGDDDAFLCMDRNRNGFIDDGGELFGYATPLRSGQPAGVGYRALAELDESQLGGNGDGKVDAHDVLFNSLCVWSDWNRDGFSQPGEIQSAESAGVVSLGYTFRETRLRDSFGNLFRYVARGEFRSRLGLVRPWFTYDVIFMGGEP